MYTKTKQMIFDYLVEETGNLQERNLNVYTANYRKTIQKNTKNTKLRDEYDSIDDIYKMLHTGVSTFTNVIGSDYSLRNSLVNIKKALHYPEMVYL